MKYPDRLTISHPGTPIEGKISLARSKSISNRALIIRALAEDHFDIHHLADSDDTQTLMQLLENQNGGQPLDAHHAGTTYRFMTSYLATQEGEQVLTGSSRMKERPIKALVDALLSLGADINYLENEGYPPLSIGHPPKEWKREVSLPAGISSQYISSLMMIAPTLPEGLKIILEGELVSKPYLEMTANIMRYFGAEVDWEGNTLRIHPGKYEAKEFTVEADWSAASYYYAIAAISHGAKIELEGLYADSVQGDSQIAVMCEKFGISTQYTETGIIIEKTENPSGFFEYDFIEQPDLAQTLSVMCGALDVNGLFTGLKTLRIKETDRIVALQNELGKFQVHLIEVPTKFAKKSGIQYYMQEGRAQENEDAVIETYRDHRMAMAFAPLALKFPLTIDQPGVVSKSYPAFWEDLQKLGFIVV